MYAVSTRSRLGENEAGTLLCKVCVLNQDLPVGMDATLWCGLQYSGISFRIPKKELLLYQQRNLLTAVL